MGRRLRLRPGPAGPMAEPLLRDQPRRSAPAPRRRRRAAAPSAPALDAMGRRLRDAMGRRLPGVDVPGSSISSSDDGPTSPGLMPAGAVSVAQDAGPAAVRVFLWSEAV